MNNQFKTVLDQAITEFGEHGFRDAAILAVWLLLLRQALKSSISPENKANSRAKASLTRKYELLVKKRRKIPQIKVDQIRPDLRRELERRVIATQGLNGSIRESAVADVIRRFEGWATSVPEGGSAVKKRHITDFITKPITKIRLEDSRVLEDQMHKLAMNVEAIIADKCGAIAGVWHSKWRQGEPYRHKHAAFDEEVFTIADNWAIKNKLMKVGSAGYTHNIEAPGELPYCRCSYDYVYDIKDLPDKMVTKKGRDI